VAQKKGGINHRESTKVSP